MSRLTNENKETSKHHKTANDRKYYIPLDINAEC
jgi:hypothetical protein